MRREGGREPSFRFFMSEWNDGIINGKVFLMLRLVWSGLVWAEDSDMRGGRFVKSKSGLVK